jgi:protein subunit release factor B
MKPVAANASNEHKQIIKQITKKDLRIETMRGSGNGGQNRNKRDTAVRITHLESGAVGYAEDERSQLQNKRLAYLRMHEHWKFKLWLSKLTHVEEIEQSKTRRYTYKGSNVSLETRKMDRE